jgi:hypothetical protein
MDVPRAMKEDAGSMHIPATQAFTREGFAFGGVLGGQPCISPEVRAT